MRARPSPPNRPIPTASAAPPADGSGRGEVAASLGRQRQRNAAIRAQAVALAEAADVGAVPLGIVPMHERPLAALPSDTRARFLDRLRLRLADVFAHPRTVPAADRSTEAAGGVIANIAGTACGVCGGACCTRGGDHAFLGVDSLARVREEHPTFTEAALFATYESHLPEAHYQDSCVYHGARGCTLPRLLRSTTCNRYNCGGLTQLLRALTVDGAAPVGSGQSEGAVIGISDNLTLRRLVLTDGSTVRDITVEPLNERVSSDAAP